MVEPEYIDDPFSERDMSIHGQGFHAVKICKKAFWSCGRRRDQFKDDHEIARWRRIDKGIADGTIPEAWVLDRCTYAERYRMNLSKLMSAIMNTGKMEEWMIRNKSEVGGGIQDDTGNEAIQDDWRN